MEEYFKSNRKSRRGTIVSYIFLATRNTYLTGVNLNTGMALDKGNLNKVQ